MFATSKFYRFSLEFALVTSGYCRCRNNQGELVFPTGQDTILTLGVPEDLRLQRLVLLQFCGAFGD